MGNCFSHLKKNKVSPEVKLVAKSAAKKKRGLFSLFGRNNSHVELPGSKQKVGEVREPATNTSAGPKERPLSLTYENSLPHQDEEQCQLSSSEAPLESSSTPWPIGDTSSEGAWDSSFFSEDGDKETDDASQASLGSVDGALTSSFESSNRARITPKATVVQRPKKNTCCNANFNLLYVVGGKKAKTTPRESKTAPETWTDEVEKVLCEASARDASQLIQELDEINSIPVGRAATNNNQDTTAYKCELPRPKTRRGPATQVGSLNKKLAADTVKRDKKNNIQQLQPVGGNKQRVSADLVRCVQDTPTVAVKKYVRFVADISSDAEAVTEDVGDSLEQGCLINERLTPQESLVYDETELGLIDQIEKEYGIT